MKIPTRLCPRHPVLSAVLLGAVWLISPYLSQAEEPTYKHYRRNLPTRAFQCEGSQFQYNDKNVLEASLTPNAVSRPITLQLLHTAELNVMHRGNMVKL